MLTREQYADWLDAYKAAWEGQDPEAAAKIFSREIIYRETPHGTPMEGREAIREYWQEHAVEGQRDISFDYKIWGVIEDIGICHWRASFIRNATHERVELDGVFHCQFEPGESDPRQCRMFMEWWHARASHLGEI